MRGGKEMSKARIEIRADVPVIVFPCGGCRPCGHAEYEIIKQLEQEFEKRDCQLDTVINKVHKLELEKAELIEKLEDVNQLLIDLNESTDEKISELEQEKERSNNIIYELNNENINLKQQKAELIELVKSYLSLLLSQSTFDFNNEHDMNEGERIEKLLQKYRRRANVNYST